MAGPWPGETEAAGPAVRSGCPVPAQSAPSRTMSSQGKFKKDKEIIADYEAQVKGAQRGRCSAGERRGTAAVPPLCAGRGGAGAAAGPPLAAGARGSPRHRPLPAGAAAAPVQAPPGPESAGGTGRGSPGSARPGVACGPAVTAR